MAKSSVLVIEWDIPRLAAALGTVTDGRVHFQRVKTFAGDMGLRDGSAAEVVDWAAGGLAEFASAAEQLIIVVPRDRVTLRAIVVPDLPAEELPDIVRMQLASRVTTAAEGLVVDFLTGALNEGPEGGRAVLTGSIPQSALTAWRTLAERLSIPLTAVIDSATATHELGARAPVAASESGPLAILNAFDGRSETVVARQGQLVGAQRHAREATAAVTTEELAGDVFRLALTVDAEPSRCIAFVDEPDPAWLRGFAAALGEGIPVTPFPVQTLISTDDQTAGTRLVPLAGAILAIHQPVVSHLNFAAPRQAPVKVDRRRLWYSVGGAGLALGMLLGWWLWNNYLGSLQDQIAGIEREIRDKNAFVKSKQTILDQAAALQDFADTKIALSEHAEKMLSLAPAAQRLIFNAYRIYPVTGSSLARVVAAGVAADRRDVEALNDKLTTAGFRVRPLPIREGEGPAKYPAAFDLEFDLPKLNAPEESAGSTSGRPGRSTRALPRRPTR